MTMVSDGLRERLAAGDVPDDVAKLAAEPHPVAPKESRLPFSEDAAIEIAWGGSAGQGDPLLRDPESVLADVRARSVSPGQATAAYGVVLGEDEVDAEATAELRRRRRAARSGAEPAPETALGEEWRAVGGSPSLLVLEHTGEQRFGCRECRSDLGPTGSNFKQRCIGREVDPDELGPLYPKVSDFVDDDVVVRQSICPGCLGLLDSEIVLSGEDPIQDIELAAGWAGSERGE
jgi:N-methylhydantoinase B